MVIAQRTLFRYKYQKNVIQLLAGHTACFYFVVCCNISFNTLKIISFRTSSVAWYLGTDKITTVFRGRGRSPFSGKIFVCLVWPDRRNVSQPVGCPQVESSLCVRTHAHTQNVIISKDYFVLLLRKKNRLNIKKKQFKDQKLINSRKKQNPTLSKLTNNENQVPSNNSTLRGPMRQNIDFKLCYQKIAR